MFHTLNYYDHKMLSLTLIDFRGTSECLLQVLSTKQWTKKQTWYKVNSFG